MPSNFFRLQYNVFKERLRVKTLDNLIWIVNLVPKLFGFSLLEDKITAPFWMVHFFLLLYIYVLGGFWYFVNFAETISEYITIYVNMSIITLTMTNSYWWLTKRSQVKYALRLLRRNDELVSKTEHIQKKHNKIIGDIRRIVIIFYGCIYMSEIVNYLPNRVSVTNEYAMTPCVGILKKDNPSKSPQREICLIMLFSQECSIMITVLNYQALLLLFIAHTAAMYQLLSAELLELNDNDGEGFDYDVCVRQRLNTFIERHTIILEISGTLRDLYSAPVGINFASNAVCIMLFAFLTKQELIKFLPVMLYCFLVFFLYCYLGQKLINAAEDFETAVYSCGWENFKLNEKRKTYSMLMQSQRSVALLAADIIPINIATFASTCQAMYKFVTVVKI